MLQQSAPHMKHSLAFLALVPSLLLAEDPCCDHDNGHGHPAHLPGSPHHPHLAINHPEKDSWFHFHPHLNAAAAIGGSTADGNWALVHGAHAPADDGFNLQGVEMGAVMEFGTAASLHFNHHLFWDRYDGWDGEWEEAFLAVPLPSGFIFRGGQLLAPFGIENPLHLHDRMFVEPPVSMVRLLGEEGLLVQGAELAWRSPDERWLLRFGYGRSPSHGHGRDRERHRHAFFDRLHGHDLEEDEDHDDHDGHEEDEHGHDDGHSHGFAGGGGIYDFDKAFLDDGFLYGRIEASPDTAFVRTLGLSFAAGENGFGRTTWIAGADLRGDARLGDRPVWWQGEIFYREVCARDSAGRDGKYDEYGIYAACGCEFAENWTTGGRLEWASGDRSAGNERRWRASANVGRLFHIADKADLHTRLQYSYDRLGGYGDEHSIWLQFVLNLGAADHSHPH